MIGINPQSIWIQHHPHAEWNERIPWLHHPMRRRASPLQTLTNSTTRNKNGQQSQHWISYGQHQNIPGGSTPKVKRSPGIKFHQNHNYLCIGDRIYFPSKADDLKPRVIITAHCDTARNREITRTKNSFLKPLEWDVTMAIEKYIVHNAYNAKQQKVA